MTTAVAVGAGAGALLLALECVTLEWVPGAVSSGKHHDSLPLTATLFLVISSMGAGGILGAALGTIAPLARRAVPTANPRAARMWGGVLFAAGAALVLGTVLHREPAIQLPDPPDEVSSRPSVVLISLDTVRADHLSSYGYARKTSPELDAFAARATLYTRAVASSDVTLATHASLFTGLYSRQHGARVDRKHGAWRLDERFETLAEHLQSASYVSVAVVANSGYLGHRWGFTQGFDHYDDREAAGPTPEDGAHLGLALLRHLSSVLERVPDPGFEHVSMRRAEEINEDVFPLLDRIGQRGQPFFLFVNYVDPHWPYDPPSPFDRRFSGRLPDGELFPSKFDIAGIRTGKQELRTAQQRHAVSMYDGEIAYMDFHLGALLQRLDDLALLDPSLVVITSDHGEALGEHKHMAHGVSVYEDQVHVPLVIKEPRQREGRVVDTLASSVDVLPTILGSLDLPVPDGIAGIDLHSGPPPGSRSVISESHPSLRIYRSHPRFRRSLRALYKGDAKLIRSSNGAVELYDLAEDPAEEENLVETSSELAQRLASDLGRWLITQPAHRGSRPNLPDSKRRLLEALGYLE